MFNCYVTYDVLTEGILKTFPVRFAKNYKYSIDSKDNYRLISLANIICKVVEKLTLSGCYNLLDATTISLVLDPTSILVCVS